MENITSFAIQIFVIVLSNAPLLLILFLVIKRIANNKNDQVNDRKKLDNTTNAFERRSIELGMAYQENKDRSKRIDTPSYVVIVGTLCVLYISLYFPSAAVLGENESLSGLFLIFYLVAIAAAIFTLVYIIGRIYLKSPSYLTSIFKLLSFVLVVVLCFFEKNFPSISLDAWSKEYAKSCHQAVESFCGFGAFGPFFFDIGFFCCVVFLVSVVGVEIIYKIYLKTANSKK